MFIEWVWSQSCDLFKFWEIIDNISEMVQDRDIVKWKNNKNHVWSIELHDCQ